MNLEPLLDAVVAHKWYPVAGLLLMLFIQLIRKTNLPLLGLVTRLWKATPDGARFLWPMVSGAGIAFVAAFQAGVPFRDALVAALGGAFGIGGTAMGGAAMLKESPIRWDGKAGGKVALLFLVLAPLSLSGCAMGSGIGAGPWLVIAFGFLLTGCGGSLQDTLRDTLKDQILPVFVKCKPSNEAMLGTLWTEFAKDPGGALSSYGRSVLEAFLLKHGVSTTVCVLDELRDRLQHQIESPGAPPEGSPEKDRQRQLLAKIDTALAEIGVEVVEDPVPGAAPCPETAPQSTEPGSGGG